MLAPGRRLQNPYRIGSPMPLSATVGPELGRPPAGWFVVLVGRLVDDSRMFGLWSVAWPALCRTDPDSRLLRSKNQLPER